MLLFIEYFYFIYLIFYDIGIYIHVHCYYRTLSLLVPATDGMGRPEDLVVHKVWWGRVLESALVVPPAVLQQAVAAQSR